MAQVQKQEVRNRIIQSAKIEFYRAGYDGANMRNIAGGADITVGNLYRYFENKDDLYKEMISKVYVLVNNTIERISEMNISMNKEMDPSHIMNLEKNKENNYTRRIIDEVITLFSEDRLSMLILLKDEKGNQVTDMKYSFIEWIDLALKRQKSSSLVSLYLAHAFVEGLIRIAEDFDNDAEISGRVEQYVKFYFAQGC